MRLRIHADRRACGVYRGAIRSAWLMRAFPRSMLLGTYAVINVDLCLVRLVHPGWLGVGCLLTTSLFMSIMFPTIFALGLKGMGERPRPWVSFIVMSIWVEPC